MFTDSHHYNNVIGLVSANVIGLVLANVISLVSATPAPTLTDSHYCNNVIGLVSSTHRHSAAFVSATTLPALFKQQFAEVQNQDTVDVTSGRTSVRYRFGSPFSSKRLWFVDTVL